jgi:tetratricopeptide (TPR) repeat protein
MQILKILMNSVVCVALFGACASQPDAAETRRVFTPDGALSEYYSTGTSSRARATMRTIERVRKNLSLGETTGIYNTLIRVIRVDPQNPFAYYYLGKTKVLTGDYERAIGFLEKAYSLFGKSPIWMAESSLLLGWCKRKTGKMSESNQAFEDAVRLNPALHPVEKRLQLDGLEESGKAVPSQAGQ